MVTSSFKNRCFSLFAAFIASNILLLMSFCISSRLSNSLQPHQRLSQLALLMVYSLIFVSVIFNPRWANITSNSSFIFSIALLLVICILLVIVYLVILWNDRIEIMLKRRAIGNSRFKWSGYIKCKLTGACKISLRCSCVHIKKLAFVVTKFGCNFHIEQYSISGTCFCLEVFSDSKGISCLMEFNSNKTGILCYH